MIRPMTSDEIKRVRDADDNDLPKPVPPEGGRYTFNMGIGKDDPSGWQVAQRVPDEQQIAVARAEIAKIDGLIARQGYTLPEAIQVGRGAYLPGVSEDDLKAMVGGVFEEKGFTSTMVGDAEGRLKGYAALGKFESLYNRFGKIAEHQDEVGSAITVTITVPAGAKVASVEAVRRLDYKFPRIQDPDVFQHPEWVTGDLKPSDFTKHDFTATPTISTKRLAEKNQRSESEVLLGSGARFKVTKVARGELQTSGDPTLKPVQIIHVHMTYIGGGSSEGTS
jgi:hypothetical protein